MNFNRYRVQSAIEMDIGCTDIEKWKDYIESFKNYKVAKLKEDQLLTELKKDSADIYFKAIFSIADAINGLYYGRHSWSVIKLYYAVFFLLRCSLATQKYAFLKNSGIYTLKIAQGESPIRRDNKTYLKEKVSGDHKTTIVTYIDIFSGSDILQSNTINDKVVYLWLMDLRNQINYRERDFTEPVGKYFSSKIFDQKQIKKQIDEYLTDTSYVYCFDEDHCALAAPLKLAQIVRKQLYNFIDFEPISQDKKLEINKLIKSSQLNTSKKFTHIYEFGR